MKAFREKDKLLRRRFERTGSMDDLNRAVEVADMAVDATPQDYPDRASRLNNLGTQLGRRFEWTGSMDDLDRAVDVVEMAVDTTPQDHPDRAGILSNLGALLGRRFERTGSMDDLNRAVEVADMAVDATPQDYPDRASRLNNLGTQLGRRFERTGSMDDLNRAVEVADMAVDATPQDYPDRASRLNNLGTQLGRRFEWTGSMDDLNHAVEVIEMAVDTTPQDHPDRASRLNNLGTQLGRRFERTGSMDDLNRAVEVADMAVDATPQDYPDRASRLNNLGTQLGRRFEWTGSMDDLNHAVEVIEMAVDTTPQDYPGWASRLNNLGTQLGRRFERTGSMDDLNRAVEVADMAVDATPQDYPDRASRLNNLGTQLGRRFEWTGSMDDLDRAVDVVEMAVDTTPQDHPDRAGILSNLGALLGRRFERTGSMDDLNRAVEVADMAVDATPQDYPDRASRLNNLGTQLGRRFERTGSMDDLDRAVDVVEMAVDATPQDHPDRAGRLNNLGNWLGMRFGRTGSMDDLNRRLSSYKEGWSCRAAPPSVRIGLARSAARILADQLNWRESSQLLQDAVELLPTVSPRSLQHMLADFAGLASMAAATALNTGRDAYHALQLLELGRGVIAGLLMEMRGDISDLKQQHPSLADEFTSLRDELDAPADRTTSLVSTADTPSVESQARRRREADQKFSELITRIRAQPGFHNFLLPPTADELMAAADPDPIVVVNVSRYRCDAFLVERHHIRALNLPNLSPGGVEISREFLRILDPSLGRPIVLEVLLEWLWEVAACPILEALGYKQSSPDNWPHIWWIPAGLLSQLPLHAAGRHLKGSGETVLDRVMSSYSSSIKALIYGRQHRGRRVREPPDVVSENGNGLLVALPETVGYANLPYAGQEVDLLEGLCTSLHLNPIKPELRREDILKHLPACEVFHFAGHGLSHPSEPSRSGLLLKDGMTSLLTVADLRDIKLQESSPFLAYLSACSTSAINAGKLVDEGIHLVNACQLAGFRHVVGTLWEVSDPHCVDMARVLYETLKEEGMTDTAVYRGVHQAIRTLRDRAVESRVSGTTTRTETVDDTDDLIQSMKATIFSNTAETNDPRRSTPEMESWRTLMRGCIEGTDTGDSEAKVRNAKALKKKLAASDLRLPDVFWVPYVHFGV
ncbi:CHAT domain-containing protein [Diaporthe sp. PMI_573]|nr:CHAT domain-containing protein [Diaporthaceae sp. PMI_573]